MSTSPPAKRTTPSLASSSIASPASPQRSSRCGGSSVVCDTAGNVYVAEDQLYIYNAAVKQIGVFEISERPESFAFCPEKRTLFVGARGSLFAIQTQAAGLQDPLSGRNFDTFLPMRPPHISQNLKRRILKDSLRENDLRDAAFRRIIRSVPKGKVSTYGRVAAAAGYPLYHRAVAKLLRREASNSLPWQRIVGAGGEVKLKGEAAAEQRLRLGIEGVKFRGKRVDMDLYEYQLRSWETFD